MKRILNLKYIMLFGIVIIVSLFMIYYIYISYAYETKERLENIDYDNYNGDVSLEEINEMKENNFFENFLSLKESFNIDSSYFSYSAIRIRIVPIIIFSIFFLYSNIKKNLIKYNIGRNNDYIKENIKFKKRIALIPPIVSLIIITIVTIIGLLSTDNNFLTYFEFLYHHNDIISYLMVNNVIVFVIFEIINFISIYILSLLLLEIVDRYGNIDGIIISLLMLWILPILTFVDMPIIYEIGELLPHSLLGIGIKSGVTLLDLILPIVISGILILWIRKLNYDKIEV